MNYHDHARASGQVPPEWGLCARCKERKEVDVVSMKGRVLELCADCQDELLEEQKNNDEFDPGKLPF
jgi:hypothetical protein